MDKRYITLFVLSNGASRTRQLKVPAGLAKAALAVSAMALLVFAFIIYDYARIKTQVPELQALMKENAGQKVQLMGLSSQIRDLEGQLAKLNMFDKKLRVIANLDVPDTSSDQTLGMGGSAADDDLFPTTGAKTAELVDRMKGELTTLEGIARVQESSFTELQEHLMKKSSHLASTPSIWPTRGWVSSTFGRRTNPFTGLPHQHKGLDIANRAGTSIVATADGVVVRISWARALGKYVVIKHGYGYKTTYGHLSEAHVRVGQRVKRGDKIASMGSTGRSTGPHLHYAVSVNGVSVNPYKYILN